MNIKYEIEQSKTPLKLIFEKTRSGELGYHDFLKLVKFNNLNPEVTLKVCPVCSHRTLSWDARGRAFVCLSHGCTHSERLFEDVHKDLAKAMVEPIRRKLA